MKSEDISNSFLSFFEKKGHYIEKSSPIINRDDPTLMFVNSGMVQFKDFFLGERTSKHISVTTNQKCIRAGGKHNDLCNVGYTKRHHTFFEMLGNFSFGSYFKEQAILYAWDFLTKVLCLSSDRIYVTHYHTDKDSAMLVEKITGLSKSHIFSINNNDNFWQMADTGPCGPCIEFFYDHRNGIKDSFLSSPNSENRFVEIWNIVFMEYNKDANGMLHNIPKKCVDTGMGLERITAVMQSVDDNFKTDIFSHTLQICSEIFKNDVYSTCNKVIADHIRSASFIISEGIVPSNQGRGYILRKILRRAISFAYREGFTSPIVNDIANQFINDRQKIYTELYKNISLIKKVIFDEEELFLENLGKGLKMIDKRMSSLKENSYFPSKEIFKLYDTHGLPLEVIEDVLKKNNLSIDTKQVNMLIDKQKNTGKASWNGGFFDKNSKIPSNIIERITSKYPSTNFVGYTDITSTSQVIAIIGKTKEDNSLELVNNTNDIYHNINGIGNSKRTIFLILDKTCFYGESGGQQGDIGTIKNYNSSQSFCAKVINTQKVNIDSNNIIIHECEIEEGNITLLETVICNIDTSVRNGIKAAHSATHLLHYMLKKYLGEQVNQSGSLVSCNKLRFDFNYNTAIPKDILEKIEYEINTIIFLSIRSDTIETTIKEAISSGAMSLFTEKYSDSVRVVTIGESKELCGGTHVENTSMIGSFVINSESSIASGIRRIEAYTGEKAFLYMKDNINKLKSDLETQKTKIHELEKTLDEKDFLIYLYKFQESNTEALIIENHNIIMRIIKIKNIPHSKISDILNTNKTNIYIKNGINIIISEYLEKKIIVIFIGDKLLEEQKASAQNIFSQLKEKFNIKGGGNNQISQTSNISNIENEAILCFFHTQIVL